MKKEFCLGDVLTVTTGKMLSPIGMEGVYAILNHMTNGNLFTHQLVRAEEVCKPLLLEQFPKLKQEMLLQDVDLICEKLEIINSDESLTRDERREVNNKRLKEWLKTVSSFYGDSFMVEQIEYEHKDPEQELFEMRCK